MCVYIAYTPTYDMWGTIDYDSLTSNQENVSDTGTYKRNVGPGITSQMVF